MQRENEISYAVRGAIFKAYNDLGPGQFESVYEAVLAHILTKQGFNVQSQVPLPVFYEDVKPDPGFRIDLLIDNPVILEIKSIEVLSDVHHKQLLTYLKLSQRKLGLLVNFNSADLGKSIIRIVNNL
jgi:GxxExxY protein